MPRRSATLLVAVGVCSLALGTALLLSPTGQARQSRALGPDRGPGRAQTTDLDGQALDPALFSPGACMAFAPTNRDRHQTVFLDAGHGGIDPGGVGSTEGGQPVDEAEVNLAVELDTMAILHGQGYRVVVSRTQDTTVTKLTSGDVSGGVLTVRGAFNDVAARDVCANLGHADVLIGIYMDSGDPWNAGCVTGYDADRPFSAANLRLATLLQDDVLGALNAQGYDIPDEGVLRDTVLGSALTSAAVAYGHLLLLGPAKAGYFETPSHMPGALIEPLFVTDPFEGSIAASAHGQQLMAAAIAKAVTPYFSFTTLGKGAEGGRYGHLLRPAGLRAVRPSRRRRPVDSGAFRRRGRPGARGVRPGAAAPVRQLLGRHAGHAVRARPSAGSGFAVLTGVTGTNANDLVIVGIR